MVPRPTIMVLLSLALTAAGCATSPDAGPTTTAPGPTSSTATTPPDDATPPGGLPTVDFVVDYGGRGFDYATAVAISATGEIWVAADYRSPDSDNGDLVLLSFSSAGELRWGRSWGGTDEDGPLRNTLAVTSDGSALVGAAIYDTVSRERDLALLKFDSAGELLWQKIALDVAGEQRPHAVLVDQTGSIYVVGHHEVDEAHRILLMKLDGNGEVIWQKTLAGDGSVESAYAATLDGEGNLILAGNVGYDGEIESVIVKTDPDGEILWQKRWGAPGQPERALDVVSDGEGNIYVSGPVVGQGQGGDSTFVLKLSAEGTLLWERSWTVSGNEVWAHGAALNSSGVLVVSGFIRRVLVDGVGLPDSGYLLGISPEGELLWQAAVGSAMKESIEGLASSGEGSVVAVGQGARARPRVVGLSGELAVTAFGLGDAGLTSVAVTLPLVDGLLAVGDAGGTVGGDADADVVLMRLTLP